MNKILRDHQTQLRREQACSVICIPAGCCRALVAEMKQLFTFVLGKEQNVQIEGCGLHSCVTAVQKVLNKTLRQEGGCILFLVYDYKKKEKEKKREEAPQKKLSFNGKSCAVLIHCQQVGFVSVLCSQCGICYHGCPSLE